MEKAKGKNKALELKKHVNAIHCTNNLSLVQRKLFNGLLFNAYHNLPNQSKFEIPTSQLCALIGYNSNDYKSLKEALLGLITTAIEWNVVEISDKKNIDRWRASSILSAASLENGICSYEYSDTLRELLYRPEIYGRIDITAQSKFKSTYGLALYENCIRYQGLHQTPWFPLSTFRKLMGVSSDAYPEFKDFKKRVLNNAVREVNEYSTINVTLELKKENKKVVSLRFKLQNKYQMLNNSVTSDQSENDLVHILSSEFSFAPELIKEVFDEYEKAYIWEKINIIKSSKSYQTGKIKAVTGLLLDALKKNYQPAKAKAAKSSYENQIHTEKAKNHLEDEYKQYTTKVLDTYLDSLSKDEFQQLLTQFENEIISCEPLSAKAYKRAGLNHAGIKGWFNLFIREQRKAEIGSILSLEEYIAQKNCS